MPNRYRAFVASLSRRLGRPTPRPRRRLCLDRHRAGIERLEDRALLTLVASGPEFVVNSTLPDAQDRPDIAVAGNGTEIVVWESYGQDGGGRGVYGQRYAADGSPLGGEFQVSTFTAGDQKNPAVAAAADGSFVVVWESAGQDGDGLGIFAQRYDAAGTAVGGEFRVNQFTGSQVAAWTGDQQGPDVAMNAAGDFVVTWSSYQDGGAAGVFARRYAASGAAVGGEFQVNTTTPGHQWAGAVAMTGDGAFTVVWIGSGPNTTEDGVYGQRFDAAGLKVGGEFAVTPYNAGFQSSLDIGFDAAGGFVVTWVDGSNYPQGYHGRDGSGAGVFARRFDAAGRPKGTDFAVNSYVFHNQWDSSLAVRADGSFVVTWWSEAPGGQEVYAREFDVAGVAQGTEVRVNTYTQYGQNNPAAAAGPDGRIVIVYRSVLGGDTFMDILGQRYSAGTLAAPPVAVDDAFSVSEDSSLFIQQPGVLANDSDPDGASLTAVLASGPAHGTLSLNADGSFTYRPFPNSNGGDSFTYRAFDGTAYSDPATVSLTVGAVNDVPYATGNAYQLDEDATLTVPAAGVLANDSDADGDALSAVLVSGPAHGTLAFNADGSFTYTPNADYHGADSFAYRASDGTALSGIATVSLTVRPANDAPVARDDAYTVREDETLRIEVATGSSVQMVSEPGDWIGQGRTYNLSDATGTFSASRPYGGPAVQISYTGNSSTSDYWRFAFDAPGSDPLTVGYYAGATRFPFNDGTEPGLDVSGQHRGSNTLTGEFTIHELQLGADGAVLAFVADFEQHSEGGDPALYGTVRYNAPIGPGEGVLANDSDIDGDPLTAVLVSGPAHGTLTLDDAGSLVYTPAKDFAGVDSFTYRTSDGQLSSEVATVRITVEPVNDAPTASPDDYRVTTGATLDVPAVDGLLANDQDPENAPLSAVLLSAPAHGTLTLDADGSFVYTPTAGYFGPDSFTYRASDGSAVSTAATVTLTVDPPQTVGVDIDPSDASNTVDLSRDKTVSAAILGSAEFDVQTVNLASLTLGRTGTETAASPTQDRKGRWQYSYADVNGDGIVDLVVTFDVAKLGLTAADNGTAVSLTLRGALSNGTLIEGSGSVNVASTGTKGGGGKPGGGKPSGGKK